MENNVMEKLPLRECKEVIEKLEALKKDILAKRDFILEESKVLDERLDELAKKFPTLKINQKQREAIRRDCVDYSAELKKTSLHVEKEIATFQNLTNPSQAELEKLGDPKNLILAAAFLFAKIGSAKHFIKKAHKDITVSHSRFCFGLDIQKKNLDRIAVDLTMHSQGGTLTITTK